MKLLEVSGAVRPVQWSLSFEGLRRRKRNLLSILPALKEPSNLSLATRPYRASCQSTPPYMEITLRNKALMYRFLQHVRTQGTWYDLNFY